MTPRPDATEQRQKARRQGGTIAGYGGFFFGVLAQLSVASETPDQFDPGRAALFVLATMAVSYALGWLLGPRFAGTPPES